MQELLKKQIQFNKKRLKNLDKIPSKKELIKDFVFKLQSQLGKMVESLGLFYDSKAGVWISKNSKAHFVPLKIEGRSDKYVAVKGLKSDDKIIILSPNKKTLKEGMRIHND